MTEAFSIEVITSEKWRREYLLTKGIVHIGSGPMSDIHLESNGQEPNVAPLHAQLIAGGDTQTSYNLVNMSNSNIRLGTAGDQPLPPRAVFELSDGQIFWLGAYQLIFHSGRGGERPVMATPQTAAKHRTIGLRLSLAQTKLAPHQTLEGTVVVSNLGPSNATITVDLEGLDEECFEIAPGPLLSSGAEKAVIFRLYHRGAKPPAGPCQITIRAIAPKSYPGEQVTVSQAIQVLPHFQHRLRLLPSAGVRVASPPLEGSEVPSVDRPSRRAGEEASLWVAPESVTPARPRPPVASQPEPEKKPEVAIPEATEAHSVEVTLPPAPIALTEPSPAPSPQTEPWWRALWQRWPFRRRAVASGVPAEETTMPVAVPPQPEPPPLWPVEPESEPTPPTSPPPPEMEPQVAEVEPEPAVSLHSVETSLAEESEWASDLPGEETEETEEPPEAADLPSVEPEPEPAVISGEVVPLPTRPIPVKPAEIWATTEADPPTKSPLEVDVWSGHEEEAGPPATPPVIRMSSRPIPPVKKPVEVEAEAIWASEEDNDETSS
jgi:hypothetical protein